MNMQHLRAQGAWTVKNYISFTMSRRTSINLSLFTSNSLGRLYGNAGECTNAARRLFAYMDSRSVPLFCAATTQIPHTKCVDKQRQRAPHVTCVFPPVAWRLRSSACASGCRCKGAGISFAYGWRVCVACCANMRVFPRKPAALRLSCYYERPTSLSLRVLVHTHTDLRAVHAEPRLCLGFCGGRCCCYLFVSPVASRRVARNVQPSIRTLCAILFCAHAAIYIHRGVRWDGTVSS